MRSDQSCDQEPDLHGAVLINLAMATRVGDAAGVLVCLRCSQQVSVADTARGDRSLEEEESPDTRLTR